MEAELSGYEEGRRSAEKFIALVDKYQNFEELTTYMLNEFVEKIVVHERDRKGSIETTQEVEIYFNFISSISSGVIFTSPKCGGKYLLMKLK